MALLQDIRAFQPTVSGNFVQSVINPPINGTVITGPEKLAQRFIVELMTEKGSLPYRPTRGTTFITEAKTGQLATEADVFAAFSAALDTVAANLTNEESTTDPDNERYASAEINQLTLSGDLLNVKIAVTSLAGISANITIPLTFNLFPGT